MKTTKPAGSSSIPSSSTCKSVPDTGTKKGTSNAKGVPDTGTRKVSSVPRSIPGSRALKSISDRQLLSSIRKLSETERKTVLSIMVHLVEIDRRKLYLPMGYSSLYEFCLRHLGYSESTAVRRVKVARCLRDFPESYRLLASGRIAMSNLVKISGVINAQNAGGLLSEIEGRSARDVDLIVSRQRPKSSIRDRVSPVYVKTVLQVCSGKQDPGPESDRKFTANVGGKKPVTSEEGSCPDSGPAAVPDNGCWPTVERRMVLEKRFKLEFGVDPEFIEKLERVRLFLSTKHHRRLEFEQLFEIMMDEYIERHSPEGRISRKEKREQRRAELDRKKIERDQRKADLEQKKAGKEAKKTSRAGKTSRTGKPAKGPISSSGTSKKPKKGARDARDSSHIEDASRYIPRPIRDEVYARDKGRCAFVAPGGKKCGSKWDLQIDHIVPFARGGDNSPSNLRLLCAKHNRLEAERAYGKAHMEQYVKEQMEQYVKEHGEQYSTNQMEKHVKEHVGQYRLKETGTTHKWFPIYRYDHYLMSTSFLVFENPAAFILQK